MKKVVNGVSEKTHHHVIIIGTGFAGLGMGIRLHQHGMTDFVLLERAAEVDGTWRDNRYPGCAFDVPSPLYSFSFEIKPDLEPQLLRTTGDLGLPTPLRRPLRPL
jgi:cation diffusion facilitator CzcD-associated flavoprotein CzcO